MYKLEYNFAYTIKYSILVIALFFRLTEIKAQIQLETV